MKGYKGLWIRNNIIRGSHDYIFELNIPVSEEKRDRKITDFQDCYFHFCEKIEDVLLWRNYLNEYVPGMKDYRLFEIETGEEYFENVNKDWVTNTITVIKEVSQEEIIEYFNDRIELYNPDIRSKFECYKKFKVVPYIIQQCDNKLIAEYIEGCNLYNGEMCKQSINKPISLDNCFECSQYNWLGCTGRNISECYYQLVRNAIIRSENIEENNYYKQLKLIDSKEEISSIARINQYWKSNKNKE